MNAYLHRDRRGVPETDTQPCAFTPQTMQGVSPTGAKPVINGVHVVPMGMANAFLIESDDGLTLIDAGFPAKEAAVFGAIDGIGRSADQLRHLVFTHGHPDHIGSAAAIVRKTGARTYMHRLDIPIAESRVEALFGL